jgi:hypothetical protein
MNNYKLFFLLAFSHYLYSVDSGQKLEYGKWLDENGNIIDGPKIKNFVDIDGDNIDDRLQFGPGQPMAPGRPKGYEPNLELEQPDELSKPLPDKPNRLVVKPDMPIEIAERIKSQELIRSLIRNGIKNTIKQLGDNPEKSEIKLALDKFKEENKHLIEQEKENAKSINAWRETNIPRRPDIPKQKSEEIIDQLKKLKVKFIDDIKNAKQEDIAQITLEYKENSKKLLNELKEKARKRRGQ